MLLPRLFVSPVVVSLMMVGAGVAVAQDYPSKPIRIVAAGPGGTVDLVARLIAPGLAASLGQPVLVDNRASNVTGELVAKAPPDGYTLLLGAGTQLLGPLLQKVSYDPVKDFAPVTLTTMSPNLLVVHPSVPVKSVKELIALAKARPGELNYSATGTGGGPHLAAELFKLLAGINIAHVPYKTTGLAINALLGGEVQLMFSTAGSMAQARSGKLRALAVTSAQPSLLLPEVPTMAASGVPGYEAVSKQGVLAPAATPAAIINRLNQEIVRILTSAEIKEKLLSTGAEPVGSSPQEFAASIKSEIVRMGKVIQAAGIRVE